MVILTPLNLTESRYLELVKHSRVAYIILVHRGPRQALVWLSQITPIQQHGCVEVVLSQGLNELLLIKPPPKGGGIVTLDS